MFNRTLWITECLVDELGRGVEILADVEGLDVFCHDSIVHHVHVAVVARSSLHVIPGSLRCIQDVSYAQFLQIVFVFRTRSVKVKIFRGECRGDVWADVMNDLLPTVKFNLVNYPFLLGCEITAVCTLTSRSIFNS